MNTSSVNFDYVSKTVPELATAAGVIHEWMGRNQHREYFDAVTLVRDVGHLVTPDHIVRVLSLLTDDQQMHVRYRVRFEDGTFSDACYASAENVPPVDFDSAFEAHDVTDDMIVPVYSVKIPA